MWEGLRRGDGDRRRKGRHIELEDDVKEERQRVRDGKRRARGEEHEGMRLLHMLSESEVERDILVQHDVWNGSATGHRHVIRPKSMCVPSWCTGLGFESL